MRYLPAVLALLAGVAGCHSGVARAKTSHSAVLLNWKAPAAAAAWKGCTHARPCVYAVYRCTASASACANKADRGVWQEVTVPARRPATTTFRDRTLAPRATAWYYVRAMQGDEASAPSNIAGPFIVGN